MSVDISLIIPAYNEEALLPRLLDTVRVARERYTGGVDRIEVIVADNASTDNTAEIACAYGCRVAPVEKRCIAAARNGGAKIARGEILCFTDADGQIHPESFNAIKRAMDTGKCVAGATGCTLERNSIGTMLAYVILMPLVWTTGMDSGVVFTRAEDWRAVGGYNEERRYAEDVQFLLDLKRLGRTRGQKLMRPKGAKTIASTRKWDTHGEWHYPLTILKAGFYMLFFRKDRINDFVEDYWYDRKGG
jgi:glycosyltransferase involved in cell wall biosynthesis